MNNLAQKLIISTVPGETPFELQGPLPSGRFTTLASLITNALPIIFALAGVILLLYLLWGGFDYLTSMGDPKKAEAGKGKITNAILGFIIIFAAYWVVQLIDYLFKLKIYNP